MKAILEFDLPDDDSNHLIALNGLKYYSALFEISRVLRDHRKYDKKLKDVYSEIEGIIGDVNLDEIP